MKQLLRPNTALQSEIEDTIIKYRNRFTAEGKTTDTNSDSSSGEGIGI